MLAKSRSHQSQPTPHTDNEDSVSCLTVHMSSCCHVVMLSCCQPKKSWVVFSKAHTFIHPRSRLTLMYAYIHYIHTHTHTDGQSTHPDPGEGWRGV